MRAILYFLSMAFCLFPYSQIVPLDSYTQPYALVFSAIAAIAAFPFLVRHFPISDWWALGGLTVLGVLGFLLTAVPGTTPQEQKYLLIYLSPIVFALAGFAIVTERPQLADRIITGAAGLWIAVGIVQTLIDPSFGTQFVGTFSEAADVVVESGRGTIGLAPEPTHYGFHMVVLACLCLLVGGRNWLALACLFTALVVARSSSALLALGVGSLIYLLLFGGKARLLLVAIIPAYFLLGAFLEANILPRNIRLVALLNEFYLDPLYLITSDTSTNARLGGVYVGAQQIWENAFVPFGMAETAWTDIIGSIKARHSWLILLSEAGIPSGILIVIFQLGVLGLVLVGYLLWRLLSRPQSHFEAFTLCAMAIVFLSQYMISTPGFGLILGVVIARKMLAGQARRAPLAPQATQQPRLAVAA